MNAIRRIQVALIIAAAMAVAGGIGPASAASSNNLRARAQALFEHANAYWSKEIAALGGRYLPAKLMLYPGGHIVDPCGTKLTFSGPFYCPPQQAVYLDQAYLQQLMQRAGSSDSDTVLAYMIGHGLARHIQAMVGTTALVEQARARSSAQLSRQTWITAALQADCYTGLWIRTAQMDGTIKSGADMSAAMSVVATVTHQRDTHLAAGVQMPDPVLDYATPQQRTKWFQRGLDTGNFNDCDTFGAQAAGKL
ncbi:MAG: neutral zinc metallopeptidase [Steroidobacteraceae bacterium]